MTPRLSIVKSQRRKALSLRIKQPQLPVCNAEIEALLHQIIEVHFPENITPPTIFFGRTPTLAHIEISRTKAAHPSGCTKPSTILPRPIMFSPG